MGALLTDVLTVMGWGEQAMVTPEYFSNLGECLASLMISELLTPSLLPTLTNRMIYRDMATRFILGFLTRAIEVRFSIRQGIPFRCFFTSFMWNLY